MDQGAVAGTTAASGPAKCRDDDYDLGKTLIAGGRGAPVPLD